MAKIIYHCYGGSHSSVITAGIYLGLLPKDRVASKAELLEVPHFDQKEAVIHGRLRFIGRDIKGNEVLVLGKRMAGPEITVFLHNVSELFPCREEIEAIDTTFPVNPLMVIGGFLSRGLNQVALGRPLVILGTQIAYPYFVQLAEGAENRIRQKPAPKRTSLPYQERHILLYICPENDPLPLLLAGLHLAPDINEQQLLDWAVSSGFTGKLGTFKYLGKAEGYDLYLAGTGREPEIMARILREIRTILEIPRINLGIVHAPLKTPFLLKGIYAARRFFSWSKLLLMLEKRAMATLIKDCRKIVYSTRIALREGILD
ncbi:MAG: DUF3189 family protein [Thermacetogeniaceae bacterium]|jgi:hypothetical protein|nr:DUF3189 family protein [Syntrophomonadaceae bacterium]